MADRGAGREARGKRVFLRFIGDHDNGNGAFRRNLPAHLWDGKLSIDRLAAGHRDCVVVQNFVGDVHTGGNCRANCQQA